MEFKEAIKIRKRICDYYENHNGYRKCNDCILNKLEDGCIDTLETVEKLDEYEKVLEKWAKEHPVMTNLSKFIEVIKNVFGGDVDKTKTRSVCIKYILGIECNDECTCKECLRWWDEEYNEPKKEGKANEQI